MRTKYLKSNHHNEKLELSIRQRPSDQQLIVQNTLCFVHSFEFRILTVKLSLT